MRWTAPRAGNLQVVGSFGTGDYGIGYRGVYVNDIQQWMVGFGQAGSFDFTRSVAAGDTIDFLIWGGSCCGGNTPVDATLAYVMPRFEPRVEATFDKESGYDSYELTASFRLAEGTEIDPSTEDVFVQVGASSITIPAGSFRRHGNGAFEYHGSIGDIRLRASITPSDRLYVKAEHVRLNGTLVPLTVKFTIGGETGIANLKDGKAKFWAKRESE